MKPKSMPTTDHHAARRRLIHFGHYLELQGHILPVQWDRPPLRRPLGHLSRKKGRDTSLKVFVRITGRAIEAPLLERTVELTAFIR